MIHYLPLRKKYPEKIQFIIYVMIKVNLNISDFIQNLSVLAVIVKINIKVKNKKKLFKKMIFNKLPQKERIQLLPTRLNMFHLQKHTYYAPYPKL